jgi:hypothetical protein
MRIFPLKPSARSVGSFHQTISVPAAVVEANATTPTEQWVSVLDDTNWTPQSGQITWDGAKWVFAATSPINLGITAIGTWMVGYRPAKMRLILSVSAGTQTIEVDLFDNGGSDYLNAGQVAPAPLALTTTPTPFEFDLDFTPVSTNDMDIGELDLFQSVSTLPWTLNIHDIQFLA